MPDRAPALLTPSLLAAHRPGALVCVALGLPAGVRASRPRGYALAARTGARLGLRGSDLSPTARAALAPAPVAPRSAVALVEIRGVLEQRASMWSCGETDGYDAIESRFFEAVRDPSVGAIVVDGDTPGGDNPGLEETGRRCRALLDEVGKPCLMFANEMIASAGYWFGAVVCDGIYTPRAGRIGSIGSYVFHATEARALEEAGVDVYIARDPAGKFRPNGAEPLDELGKARLDRMAKAGTERFVAAVAARRRMTPEAVRALDAELLDGSEAVAKGLADGIGTLEETIALAASRAALKGTAA